MNREQPMAGSKIKKAAEYDGRGCWSDYLTQFEMVADLNGWNDEVKAMELATSLRGNAQSVLTDLSVTDRRNFGSLVTALANRFEPINQNEIYRVQLKSRQRRSGESLAELAQEVKRLIRRAYPDATSELRATLGRGRGSHR